jgi:hypothetical protein
MIMDLSKDSTLRRPRATARPGDTTLRNRAVRASCVQAARTEANDQSSYEAALSEGWAATQYR